jgi:hypothetical protein
LQSILPPQALGSSCPLLEVLRLDHCQNISSSGFKARLPQRARAAPAQPGLAATCALAAVPWPALARRYGTLTLLSTAFLSA